MRVLIVDDDASVRDVLRQQFEGRGHEVYTAPSVTEALTVLLMAQGRFDVIVTDRDLGPGKGGVEFQRLLSPGHYQDRFVFFTADVEGLHKRTPAVEKPNFEALIAAIERIGPHD